MTMPAPVRASGCTKYRPVSTTRSMEGGRSSTSIPFVVTRLTRPTLLTAATVPNTVVPGLRARPEAMTESTRKRA
jgi:hypothetical protein